MLITISWSCLRDIRSKGSGTGRAPSDEPIVYMTIFYRSNSTIIYCDFLFISILAYAWPQLKKCGCITTLSTTFADVVHEFENHLWFDTSILPLYFYYRLRRKPLDGLYFLSFSQYYRFDNFKYKNVQCLYLTIPSTPFFWTITNPNENCR